MIRGVWSAGTVAWLLCAALLPTVAIVLVEQGATGIYRLALALAVIAFWQAVFALTRGVAPSPAGAVTAVAVVVLAQGPVAAWQLVLALSFGTVIGELIFGGWGRNVLNAGVVALAFLYFSFPDTAYQPAGPWIAAAALPAAVLLLATGILSWRVLLGAAIGNVAATAALGPPPDLAVGGALAFGMVFLVGDPVGAAATNPGRLVYGVLAGGLAGLFAAAAYDPGAPQAIVFAALIASIFAPLIDQGAIEATIRLEARRHG